MEHLSESLRLLGDKNLVWSDDFEAIRKDLRLLMAKVWEMEYAGLEPEIGNLARQLVRGENARRPETTAKD